MNIEFRSIYDTTLLGMTSLPYLPTIGSEVILANEDHPRRILRILSDLRPSEYGQDGHGPGPITVYLGNKMDQVPII